MALETIIYEYLVRLGRLLDAEDRAAESALQPAQLQALLYLGRCNRYSDRPAAVAEYLAVTKGTASQTLRVLEERGLITKHGDPEDRRQVHLELTDAGREVVRGVESRQSISQAVEEMPEVQRQEFVDALEGVLRSIQRRQGGRSFGVCKTCRHFETQSTSGFRCGLTKERLTVADSALICREHEDRVPSSSESPSSESG